MSNKKTVFITLTPRSLFFFGGEQGETADYFLKGSFMPQQSAILGLVRHQVLLQNNLMTNNRINDDETAKILIGAKSFEYHEVNQSFGKIYTISPCYLLQKSESGRIIKHLPFSQPYYNSLQVLDGNYFLSEFDPKQYYPDKWRSLDKREYIYNQNEERWLYKEVIKPGVDKNYNGQNNEGDDAYFKQVWLKMNNDFAFGFYLSLHEDVTFKSGDVTFGKESSSFYMEVSEPVDTIDKFIDDQDSNTVMLTSDTYVTEDISSFADFSITDTLPFRNIVSPVSSNIDYSKIDKNQSGALNMKSKVRLLLLKRGSVFYCKSGSLDKVCSAIDKHINFKNIGYNHYHLQKITY